VTNSFASAGATGSAVAAGAAGSAGAAGAAGSAGAAGVAAGVQPTKPTRKITTNNIESKLNFFFHSFSSSGCLVKFFWVLFLITLNIYSFPGNFQLF
jgi:hypothetical protein